ncbi:MAG: alpha/beta hydrolase [Gammaproteobacteria bacterium]
MTQTLLPHIKTGSDDAEFSVIWMHGLGADGYDFEPIIPELGLSDNYKIRFILPHAPTQAVTINGGMEMPSWYDILDSAKIDAQQDTKGIHQAADYIKAFINNEIAQGIPAKNIFLVGFSQGGVVALQTGLRYPEKLAGILALSTYLPLPDTLPSELNAANKDTPLMMTHGLYDQVIPIAIGQHSRDLIEQAGVKIEWHEYPMEHAVIPEEIEDMSKWFKNIIKTS